MSDADFLMFKTRFDNYIIETENEPEYGLVWAVSNPFSKKIYRFNSSYDADSWAYENYLNTFDEGNDEMRSNDDGWRQFYSVSEIEFGFIIRMGYTQMN